VLGDRIAHVVLNAALVPEEGGCGLDCMQPHHRDGLRAAVELARAGQGPMPTTAGPPADAERFRTTYGGDPLTDDELAFVVDPERCVVDTVHHYFQPVHWSHAAGVGITYLVNDRDRPVPPEMQLEMTGRLPGDVRVVHLDSGHVPAITRPAELAGVIESSW